MRAMQKQGSIVHPLRDLANCSKLRMANVGWAEFKPHLRGSLGHGPNQHKRAVPRRGHGAKSLTQHRHAGPSANSGSVDTVPEPSGCTPLSLSSCDHRQAALSAAGCISSCPEGKQDLHIFLKIVLQKVYLQALIACREAANAARCAQGRLTVVA